MAQGLCIALEGMPGAGKTTSLLSSVKFLNNTSILLPETNPEPDVHYEDLTDYFANIELERMNILSSENALQYNFILDRCYISNLAYIYATENLNNYYNGSSSIAASYFTL